MNYSMEIKLLYLMENPEEVVQLFRGNTNQSLRELERIAGRKFRCGPWLRVYRSSFRMFGASSSIPSPRTSAAHV